MAIVIFVPLVPLMVQVADTHIDTCKFLQTNLKYYIPLPNNDLQLLEKFQIILMYRYVYLPLVP